MILGRWVAAMVVVVVAEGAETDCSWIGWINEDCIQDIQCAASANLLIIWEDCPVGSELLTYNATTSLPSTCEYISRKDETVSLKIPFDAEKDNLPQKFCAAGGAAVFTQFTALDVNEYDPLPVNQGQTFEVNVNEGVEAGEIASLIYNDEDYQETEKLVCEMTSTDYKDKFEMTGTYEENSNQMVFSLKTLQPLDFEELMFYKLTFNISSVDARDVTRKVTQTILVSLTDVGDNPPYWVHYTPTYNLKECDANTAMFKMEARDRDVVVNNDIHYSITSGDDANYFKIDEITGDVSTNKKIDREALLELGITSFTINITAQEYDKSGEPIDPNTDITSSTQVTVIYIVDVNDNIPTFNDDSFSVDIPELTMGDTELPLAIYVTDMDEGENGHYKITSNSADIVVSPAEGRGNTSITLTAKWNNEQTTFDYETQLNKTLSFMITATEVDDLSHLSSIVVFVTLSDVNDNSPVFSKSPYSVHVPETTPTTASLVTVDATDNDISPEFNTESIKYSLKSCTNMLHIDDTTGEVTLTSPLDFEKQPSITCDVEARDEYGDTSGNAGSSQIQIDVDDIVDEPPEFTDIPTVPPLEENSAPGSLVVIVQARDIDANADISFSIDWDNSIIYKDQIAISLNISSWFTIEKLTEGNPSDGIYQAQISVSQESPDREKADEINLHILVVDGNTQVNRDNASGSVDITITDLNDSPPEFISNGYDKISVQENSDGKTVVATIKAQDPDVNDPVMFSINDQAIFDLSDVDNSTGIYQVDLLVQEGAVIDREAAAEFSVIVTITDSADHSFPLPITIKIIDLNDNAPVIDQGICNVTLPVMENIEVGYIVTTIVAQDADKEGAHKDVNYLFLNEQLPTDQNLHLPFQLDKYTGIVSVSGDHPLDRETYSEWELIFTAYDGCEPNELGCKVQQSDVCHIFIKVEDENDERPGNFQLTPNDASLIVNEFMKEGQEATSSPTNVIYEISALDGDEENTDNTVLTYEVLSVRNHSQVKDIDMFKAVNKNRNSSQGVTQYFCTLQATRNLTGLKGVYDIEIMAKDHGDPSLNGNKTIPLIIEDANDNTPRFRFEVCVVGDLPTVRMQEGAYDSGQDVFCTTDSGHGKIFTIYVDDDDLGVNKEVDVAIDFTNTTVEGSHDDSGQKKSFKVTESGDHYTLQVTEPIDREKGSAYNLSLHVVDHGVPPLESWSVVRVIVTNKFEYPPYFCAQGMCVQTLYMIENYPNVKATFINATDKDNTNVDETNPDEYDTVYYEIISTGSGADYFELVSNTKTELQLKNKVQGLDRETVASYDLEISTNNGGIRSLIPGEATPTNSTLYVTILVQDENDNAPEFPGDKVIFASFTPSDSSGKPLTTVKALDIDLNETLKYSTVGDFEWFETEIKPLDPFSIKDESNNTGIIYLNFVPTGSSDGYCTFTITVVDAVNHQDNATVKVYAITKDYQLPVYFKNYLEDVNAKKDEVQMAFSMAYGYPCLIDNIAQSTTDSEEPIDGESTVLMHFINDGTHTPVPVKEILDATNDAALVTQLMGDLRENNLNLKTIGTIDTGSGNGTEQKLLVLQVLLGVVSLVLGSLCFLLITVYCLRTRSLKRRVKVLSTNTFGSHSSELNRVGTELAAIPGSNKFTGEGANPMYNMPDSDLRNDSSSIGSGDSVLVGIEDNPEFKRNKQIDSYTGIDNGAFGRSIDQVSAPSALSGGSRTNPLLLQLQDSAEDHDLADGVPDYNFGNGSQSSGSDESFHNKINSNFSFGN